MPPSYLVIKEEILQKLRKNLPPQLGYHSIDHTLDVLHRAEEIASKEKVSQHDLFLLSVACLYHDSGFLEAYKGHEEKSCELARKDLVKFGIALQDIDTICNMIMATKIPQSPKNKLEEIICDADLDYLGRYDFFPIAEKLFKEMKLYGFINTEEEWNRIQKSFLEQHHYFTETSRQRRESQKGEHLAMIIKSIASSASQ